MVMSTITRPRSQSIAWMRARFAGAASGSSVTGSTSASAPCPVMRSLYGGERGCRGPLAGEREGADALVGADGDDDVAAEVAGAGAEQELGGALGRCPQLGAHGLVGQL